MEDKSLYFTVFLGVHVRLPRPLKRLEPGAVTYFLRFMPAKLTSQSSFALEAALIDRSSSGRQLRRPQDVIPKPRQIDGSLAKVRADAD
eukprot:s9181_g2.t1